MLKSCSPFCFSSSGKALERSVRASSAKLFACLSKSGKRSPTKKSAVASMSFCEQSREMFVHSVRRAHLSGPPGNWGRLLLTSNIGKIESRALASRMLGNRMRLRLKQTHLFYFAELSPNQLSLSFSKLESLFLCFPLLESNWLLWYMLKPEQNIHSACVRFLCRALPPFLAKTELTIICLK